MQTTDAKTSQTVPTSDGFVSGRRLLELLFPDEASRPSIRTLYRLVQRKRVPCLRLNRLTFYQPELVRKALESQMTTSGRQQ